MRVTDWCWVEVVVDDCGAFARIGDTIDRDVITFWINIVVQDIEITVLMVPDQVFIVSGISGVVVDCIGDTQFVDAQMWISRGATNNLTTWYEAGAVVRVTVLAEVEFNQLQVVTCDGVTTACPVVLGWRSLASPSSPMVTTDIGAEVQAICVNVCLG